ncbi:(d)CMP kinase [Bacillota bacterium LX-D]|nr:(d)CMP kinase [Bacillota bacterium LX-D]
MLKKGNIAIDGPAGAGKSTVAKLIAKKLGYLYVDTGAMYRALAWKALQEKFSYQDVKNIIKLAQKTEIVLTKSKHTSAQKVFCDGFDVTEEIRTPEVSEFVSQIAQIPEVREVFLHQQRKFAKDGNVVMDGRDIGSNVLPDAAHKFFLTASLEERTKRRYNELKCKGYNLTMEQIRQDIARRDQLDSKRKAAPLVKALDAVEIDTSNLSPRQVASVIENIIKGESYDL